MKLEYLPDDKEFGKSRARRVLAARADLRAELHRQPRLQPGLGRPLFHRPREPGALVSIGNLQQDGYVTYDGALGRYPYSAQARVQSFQTLQDPLAPIDPPYHRVPQLTFTSNLSNVSGSARLDAAGGAGALYARRESRGHAREHQPGGSDALPRSELVRHAQGRIARGELRPRPHRSSRRDLAARQQSPGRAWTAVWCSSVARDSSAKR